jgi:phytanoyl-CoA hydroxylase
MSNPFKDFIDTFGFVKLEQHFTGHFCEKLCKKLEHMMFFELKNDDSGEVFYEGDTKFIKQIQYLHQRDKVFGDILARDVPKIVRIIYGEDIPYTVLNMQLFRKLSKISKPTRSHQDNAYFKLKGPLQPITIWISLDEIDEENGCLYYLPGSHKHRTLFHDRYSPDTTFRVRSGVPGLSLCLPEYYEKPQVPVFTNPGDVCVHFANTIHRAGANTSDNYRERRAIGIVVIPQSCEEDEELMRWHKEMLSKDIELQIEEVREELSRKYITKEDDTME